MISYRSVARKKKQGAVAQPHEEEGDGKCRRLLRGATLQRSSELFVELHFSAAPSSSWSCIALHRSSELFVELRCKAAPSLAQL
jgi:hypothetical protein